MNISLRLAARTDRGMLRPHNEDNFLVGADLAQKSWNKIPDGIFPLGELGLLLAVADGMGGAEAGEVASAIAVNTLQREFEKLKKPPESTEAAQQFIHQGIMSAHQDIAADAQSHPERRGMGTTAMLAWVWGNELLVGWSGDSRAYLLGGSGSLKLLSQDHSMVWDLVKAGRMTAEQARTHPDSNVITQSLGDAQFSPQPEFSGCQLSPGDKLLLCSDGLNGMLPDPVIEKLLSADKSPEELCNQLTLAANAAGGDDNITVLVMEVVEIEDEGKKQVKETSETSEKSSPNQEESQASVEELPVPESPPEVTRKQSAPQIESKSVLSKNMPLLFFGAILLIVALIWWIS